MNERQQLELENYLREFHPRAPKSLPSAVLTQTWRRLAAAAAIVFFFGTSLWLSSRTPVPSTTARKFIAKEKSPSPSTIVLTRLALENPSSLDALLATSSRTTLPRFDRPDGALQILAKE